MTELGRAALIASFQKDEIDMPDFASDKRRIVYVMQSIVCPSIIAAVYDNLEAALSDKKNSIKYNAPMRIIKRLVNS